MLGRPVLSPAEVGPGLRQLYAQADPADRPLIAEWVAHNDDRIPQAPRRGR